jgi:hypothetical protein
MRVINLYCSLPASRMCSMIDRALALGCAFKKYSLVLDLAGGLRGRIKAFHTTIQKQYMET